MKKYKIYIKLCSMVMLGIMVAACSENDPLSDLGEKKDKVPFVRLSSIENIYNAGDTIEYEALYWSVNDKLKSLSNLMGDQTSLSGTLSVDDGAGEVSVAFDTVFTSEIVKIGPDMEHNPLDYQTARNSYVRELDYIIPAKYQLWGITEVNGENFAKVNGLSFSDAIKTVILDRLKDNGVPTTWENIADIATSVELKIESSLQIQVRVTDEEDNFNESSESNVKVGAYVEG